eukprot:3912901-Pleurochrysis_carterae.AAC.1
MQPRTEKMHVRRILGLGRGMLACIGVMPFSQMRYAIAIVPARPRPAEPIREGKEGEGCRRDRARGRARKSQAERAQAIYRARARREKGAQKRRKELRKGSSRRRPSHCASHAGLPCAA